MSQREGFLSRWSRRKRQADEQAAEQAVDAPAPLPSAPGDAEVVPPHQDAAPPQAEAATPAVDLTKLPPLESITAGTDIRDFLAAGVPEALKRAALRRAWAADPAIRDFIGLSENAWDFTAPDGVPGFGPMLPTDDVARMAAQVTRGMELPKLPIQEADASSKPAASARESDAFESSPAEDSPPSPATTQSHMSDESNSSVSSLPADRGSAGDDKVIDIAAQNDPVPDPGPVRRGHGGALPQ